MLDQAPFQILYKDQFIRPSQEFCEVGTVAIAVLQVDTGPEN